MSVEMGQRRPHQIPDDQGECGGVLEFHTLPPSDTTRKPAVSAAAHARPPSSAVASSARLRRTSANCALVTDGHLPPRLPIAPQPETRAVGGLDVCLAMERK